jgi:hypothetical protein
MKRVYYEKKGRRYVPVAEYDSEFLDSLPRGNHLLMVYPGGSSCKYNITPDYAAMIAAGRVAEDAISRIIMRETELRRNSRMPKELTPGQRDAWDKLILEYGEEARQLEWPSAREASAAAVAAMMAEAQDLLKNETVRLAWEQFMMVAALCKDQENTK